MNKLRRYSAVTKTGIVTVCLDADVSALEAENERLKAEIANLADGWEAFSSTSVCKHREIYVEHARYLRAILNTPAAGGKEE